MLLVDAALLVFTRIAPQARIDDLALSLRNIVFMLFMLLYALYLLTYIREDLAGLPHLFELIRASEGASP
jgi:type III secretion protein T